MKMNSENKPEVLFELNDFQNNLCCLVEASEPPVLVLKESTRELSRLEIPKELIDSFNNQEKSTLEIEAKYLLKSVPENLGTPIEIEQAYPIISEDGSELRVRKKGESKFYLSIKQGSGAIRSELTLHITEDEFNKLKDLSKPRIISKKRYLLELDPTQELTLELDQYSDQADGIDLKGLVVAEIEFPDQQQLKDFPTSSLSALGLVLDKEVTNDAKFSNKQLALTGLKGLF